MRILKEQVPLVIFLVVLLVIFGVIAIMAPWNNFATQTTTVYRNGVNFEVATPSNYSLPAGAIIHQDYGKIWKCVEINGSYLLIRDSGSSSLAVKVDSCDIRKKGD